MFESSSNMKALKKSIKEDLARIAVFIASYTTSMAMNPLIGTALSLSFTSMLALRKLGMIINKHKMSEYLNEVQKEIIELDMEIEKRKRELSLLIRALEGLTEETRRVSLEDEIKVERMRLRVVEERKLYLEALMRSLKVIESFRYEYGDVVDEIFERVVSLSIKAAEGEISENELSEVVDRISSLTKSPDLPYLLIEIAQEKLSSRY